MQNVLLQDILSDIRAGMAEMRSDIKDIKDRQSKLTLRLALIAAAIGSAAGFGAPSAISIANAFIGG